MGGRSALGMGLRQVQVGSNHAEAIWQAKITVFIDYKPGC